MRSATKAVHLDTSFLIRALIPDSEESMKLHRWLDHRSSVAVSAFTWGEFLCGPLGEAEEAVALRVAHRHVPVGTEEVTEAARLFNFGGRRRGSFPDCIIAGTAMVAGAELATSNRGDFQRFMDAGLELAE